jgi:hypothetical protein
LERLLATACNNAYAFSICHTLKAHTNLLCLIYPLLNGISRSPNYPPRNTIMSLVFSINYIFYVLLVYICPPSMSILHKVYIRVKCSGRYRVPGAAVEKVECIVCKLKYSYIYSLHAFIGVLHQ